MSNIYYTDTGNTVVLDKEIGRGGEGIVYLIQGYPSDVAKIYIRAPSAEVHRKILTMLKNPPNDPTVNGPSKHRSIAWPNDVLYLDRHKEQFAGFKMPRIEMKVFKKILNYFSPEDRTKIFLGGFTWLHLYTAAYNLASCVAAAHESGYCIGDINESNILIAPTAPLTLIDCDSFQVKDPNSNEIWRCTVGKDEYSAPEIIGKNFRDIDRTQETDCFGLAIMIFQLLMEGFHPYSARGALVNDAPATRDKINKGIFPYTASSKDIEPPTDAPPFNILHPEIQDLFKRCFDIGHRDPSARPSAKEWMMVLGRFSQQIKKCFANENHRYLSHLNSCPWCDRAKKMGRDSFPSLVGQQIILPDPNNQMISLDDRKAHFLTYIEMALSDGFISQNEEEYLIEQGLRLHISEKETKKLLSNEVQKRGIQVKTGVGIPRLEIIKTNFDFNNLRVGFSVSESFTISNSGGGTLSGPIKSKTGSGKNWLRVSQSNIDTSRHRQDITFYIETSGLDFGMRDIGEIEILSNGGTGVIIISLSVEIPETAISRFRLQFVPAVILIGASIGILSSVFLTEVGQFVGGISLIALSIYIGKKENYGAGCWTFIIGMIVLIILTEYYPRGFSVASGILAFAMIGLALSKPLFVYHGSGKKYIPAFSWALAGVLFILVLSLGAPKKVSKVGLPRVAKPVNKENIQRKQEVTKSKQEQQIQTKPFRIRTWGFGPGAGKGVDIQLVSVDVGKDKIKIGFGVKSDDHKDILLYGIALKPEVQYPSGYFYGESLYIVDDKGKKVYSTTGFVGGRQSKFNSSANQIHFDPREKIFIFAEFPKVGEDAKTVKFVSPMLHGHQNDWSWDKIPLKSFNLRSEGTIPKETISPESNKTIDKGSYEQISLNDIMVECWATDLSDGRIGGWKSTYPHCVLDDGGGDENAIFNGRLLLEGDQLSIIMENLSTNAPPNNVLAVGFRINLKNRTFSDGTTSKVFEMARFRRSPSGKTVRKSLNMNSQAGIGHKKITLPSRKALQVESQKEKPFSAELAAVDNKIIRVTGIAIESTDTNMSAGARELGAKRAAKLIALRNLAELVSGVKVEDEISVRDSVIKSNQVRATVDAFIQGASVVSERKLPDGSYEVELELDTEALRRAIHKDINKNIIRKGTWSGKIVQFNYGSYNVIIELSENDKGIPNASIQYPSLKCGGYLTLIDIQDAKYLFHEKVKGGTCVDNGIVHLTKLGEERVKYEWYFQNGKRDCEGILSLTRPSP